VAVTDPKREPMRPSEVIGIDLRDRRNGRQASYRNFNAGGEDRGQNHSSDSDENGGANPNPEAAILWAVHCRVRSIEGNHNFYGYARLKGISRSMNREQLSFVHFKTVRLAFLRPRPLIKFRLRGSCTREISAMLSAQ